MKTFTRVALPVLLALSISGSAAFAQAPKDGEQRGPSPEMMSRFQDGKLAAAKATLKLSDEQLKLWAPVEEQIRKIHDDRIKTRTERRAQMKDGDDRRADDATPLPDRLEKRSAAMAKHAEQTKALAAAMKPLFASFSEDQKQVAGPVFAQLIGGGKHGMHGGWQGRGHHGHGGPMMHRGRMDGGMRGMGGPETRGQLDLEDREGEAPSEHKG